MAFSLVKRVREHLEQFQSELTPESGFDRRAYGYGEAAGEDAAFDEIEAGETEEESPWRQRADYHEPDPASDEPSAGSPFARTSQSRERGSAAPASVRADAGSRAKPASPPLRARASAPPPGTAESERAWAASRTRRLRARLKEPDSLREMFLLREVIDRPVAFRRRRGSTPPREPSR